jgi:hypothetical protein
MLNNLSSGLIEKVDNNWIETVFSEEKIKIIAGRKQG